MRLDEARIEEARTQIGEAEIQVSGACTLKYRLLGMPSIKTWEASTLICR